MISAPINRIKCLMPSLFATGDDEGVIKVSIGLMSGSVTPNVFLHL